MTVKVVNQITNKKRYYTGINPCDGATVHQTGNTNKGADAQAHANLQSKGNVRVASWHVTIDDEAAFQSYEDKRQCWHAGDGRGPGNLTTISYELCVNSDGDYVKTIDNAAQRIAMDVKEYGWSRSDIHQHNEFSTWGKNCPQQLRGSKADISWDEFVDMIFKYANGSKPKPKPKPKPSSKANGKTEVDGYWGTDVTIELQYALHTPVDGEVWRQSASMEDDNTGLTHGWKWNGKVGDEGSPLIHKLYAFLVREGISKKILGKDDGKIGPNHIKGLQTWLTKVDLYDGSIDGELWAKGKSIKGLQTAINKGLIK